MKNLKLNLDNENRVNIKRKVRKNLILSTVIEKSPISISQIAKITGFNMPTATSLVEELVQEGYLQKIGVGKSTGGRPPVLYRINPESKYIVGVDLGRSTTNIVLINLEQNLLIKKSYKTGNIDNKEASVDKLVNNVNDIIAEANIAKEKILGVGVAIPGLIEKETGRSITYFDFGPEQTIQQILSDKLGLFVKIENDARVMALGEQHFGLAKNVPNALCLNLGWGIGLGLIIDGKIYSGNNGFAGEFGHIIVDEHGPLCHCGKKGCLETVASGHAIAEIAKKALKEGAASKILESVNDIEEVTAFTVVENAKQGDIFSIEILERTGIYIGQALSIVINLFDPAIIIIGGSLAHAGRFILNPIITASSKMSRPHINEKVKIVTSQIGPIAGALGATTLITKEILETDHINLATFV